MTFYELLLALHIVAAIIWLGSGFFFAVLVFEAERARDMEKEARYHSQMDWLAPSLFIPASLAVLLIGVALVIDGVWSFGDLWIVIGLAGWAVSFGLGFFYFKPEGERIGKLAAERGPADPEIGSRVRRLNIVDRVQVLILFLVVFAMVFKPTGDDVGMLIAGGAILLAAIVAASAALRRGGHRRAGEAEAPAPPG